VFKMMSAVKQTNIDFVRWWKLALAASFIIIVGTWILMIQHYRKDDSRVLGVDFTGGTSVTVSFTPDKKPDVEAIRNALGTAGIQDAFIQYQKSESEGSPEQLQIKVASKGGNVASVPPAKTSEAAVLPDTNAVAVAGLASSSLQTIEQDNVVMQVLARQFSDAGFKLLQQDYVGPQVSMDLARNAQAAMILSLVAMIIYISLRFKFGFALGAVAALFHDVLITAGLVHLLGFQINMTVLAALMTIVGYSVNDTIVIFDRIREDLRLYRNKSFVEICNQAINETLSRTLLTNFLTSVSVIFLLVLAGQSLRDFSVAMFIGMIAGTYSTMYIATPVVLMWYRNRRPDLGKIAKIG
ncbi:MAG: protein translocase subunit SecF, partial [bacterium]